MAARLLGCWLGWGWDQVPRLQVGVEVMSVHWHRGCWKSFPMGYAGGTKRTVRKKTGSSSQNAVALHALGIIS